MIKYKLLLYFLFIGSCLLNAQNLLTGSIVDQSGKAIDFVEIQIQEAQQIIKKSYTDESGSFSIELPNGNYRLVTIWFGEEILNLAVDLTANKDLGIVTANRSLVLSEITVKAKRNVLERKVDRLIFNVQNSIVASGGNAFDVLRVTPRIRVQDEQVMMVGRNEMQIMVNDRLILLPKEDVANYLKSISSSNIKKIEVIPNPPANYDAEGSNGLVNIVLKKAQDDLWNADVRGNYTQTTYPAGNLGSSFNFRKDKLTLNSSIDWSDGSRRLDEEHTYTYPLRNVSERIQSRDFRQNINGRIGLDYRLSPKLTFSLGYSGSQNNYDRLENHEAKFMDITERVDSFILTDARQERKTTNHIIDTYTQYKLGDNGQKVTLNLGYISNDVSQNRDFSSNTFLENQEMVEGAFNANLNTSDQLYSVFNANLDFVVPLSKLNLEFGGKLSFIENDSDLKLFDLSSGESVFDPLQSNEFQYQENIQAVYVSGSKSIDDKWEIKAGFRLEMTQTEGFSNTLDQTNNLQYTKLFPTLYIDYIPNEDHALNLSYGRRIRRPRFSALNPFRWYTNPYSFIEGNPFLEPSFKHNVEFSHIFMDNLFTTVYYTYGQNESGLVTNTNANSNLIFSRPENYFNSHEFGFSSSYTFYVGEFFENYLEAALYWNKANSENLLVEDGQGWGADIVNTTTLFLNKANTLTGGIDIVYLLPSEYGVFQTEEQLLVNASIKLLIFEKKGTLALTVNDIFRTGANISTSTFEGVLFRSRNYEDFQRARLSFNYKFGKKKARLQSQKRGNREEKSRLK